MNSSLVTFSGRNKERRSVMADGLEFYERNVRSREVKKEHGISFFYSFIERFI